MRQSQSVTFGVLAVVAKHAGGVHGYRIKRQGEQIFGHLWQLNLSEIYRVLNILAAKGWIRSTGDDAVQGRKLYCITDDGRDRLAAFVGEPPTDLPRSQRQELAVKLLLATAETLPEFLQMLQVQRDVYADHLHLLAMQRRRLHRLPFDAFLANLLIDGIESVVRAEIAWLDRLSQKLTERYAGAEL